MEHDRGRPHAPLIIRIRKEGADRLDAALRAETIGFVRTLLTHRGEGVRRGRALEARLA